ncbi:MAG: SDR family NAD(P)-dependent oxidoreductase [Mycobacterium sp.]|uniref:SDR family NAD(P)-dependent oxidoreductase n=1 Tax=Mycobacterium sp. TaxID=1785 RepID=UPI003C40B38F
MIGPFGRSSKVSHHARAVVTGAGSGIGAAFAIELAHRGGRVVCSDIDEVAAARTVSAITDNDGEAVAIACDVTRFDDVRELAAQSESWFGAAPTLVINNSGVGSGGASIGELSLEDWQWVLGINLWGPIHGCHVFAPILRSAEPSNIPRGIINVASAAAFGAAPTMAAYNVSKAGVLSLSETLAAELSGSSVKVTVLCPTFVKTDILESARIAGQTTQLATKLMRWTGASPTKVAHTCLDAHDRGELYCMPQLEAKIGWNIKRLAPGTFTRAIGLASRAAHADSTNAKEEWRK